jgi:hypothetical protein
MKRLIILAIFSSILFSGCAVVHHYDGYQGKVIDVETKEPLEGAAVLVEFNTQEYGPAGSVSHYVDAHETLTDKNGEFRIPSFTTTAFRPLQSFESYGWVTIFKPGYGCFPNHKGVKPEKMRNGILPTNDYVTIELPKLRSREERLNLPSVNFDIPFEKQQRYIELLNQELESLGANGKYTKESFIRR